MSTATKATLKGLGLAAFIAAYALLSHWLLITPALQSWAAAWAVIPLLVLFIIFLVNLLSISISSKWMLGLQLGLVGAAALHHYWPLITGNNDRIYFLQHVGTNAFLGWLFGHTLLKGKTPFITSLARVVHGELPAHVQRYTRQVTLAWTLFFALICIISVVLFVAAPLSYWSFFANILTWPLVALMFLLEYAARKVFVKDFHSATISQSINAYMKQQRGDASKSSS